VCNHQTLYPPGCDSARNTAPPSLRRSMSYFMHYRHMSTSTVDFWVFGYHFRSFIVPRKNHRRSPSHRNLLLPSRTSTIHSLRETSATFNSIHACKLFSILLFCYFRGGLYNLNIRELQTTETELRCIRSERGINRTALESTYDNAMAREAQTGPSRMCPIGYKAPAAIGSAATLYTSAHN
jgi:hypothetical protein